MIHDQWTDDEKRRAFETISGYFYQRNFGRMGKADLDLLMFSFYLDHLSENNLPDDDYSISTALGITESRVRNMKIKRELQYPSNKNWKEDFIKRIPYAVYDDKTALVKVSIPDPNVKRELEHFIDEHNWYSEYQLNTKLLQMRADQFIKLSLAINEEYSQESGKPIESEEEIENRLKKCASSAWINADGERLIEKLRKDGIEECLPEIAKSGAKTALKIGMNAIPLTAPFRQYVDYFIDNL